MWGSQRVHSFSRCTCSGRRPCQVLCWVQGTRRVCESLVDGENQTPNQWQLGLAPKSALWRAEGSPGVHTCTTETVANTKDSLLLDCTPKCQTLSWSTESAGDRRKPSGNKRPFSSRAGPRLIRPHPVLPVRVYGSPGSSGTSIRTRRRPRYVARR